MPLSSLSFVPTEADANGCERVDGKKKEGYP
jgi:hypothetical protein